MKETSERVSQKTYELCFSRSVSKYRIGGISRLTLFYASRRSDRANEKEVFS